ncbi:MAG: ABC transporter permease [Chloroflexi bacterium]|nr:ABC transporter permease [Chloroflexota bacterium]PWB43415.1 MAG: ABC transporter [Dehalococcoidia bacterium]
MSTFASQTWWLLQRKLLESWRAPAWIVVALSTPLLYLALFGPLLNSIVGAPGFPPGSSALDIFVPGVLVIVAFGAGMGAGWTVITELDTGVLERLRVTPASRLALLLGPVLRDVVTFVVPAIVVTIAAQPFGYHPDATGTAVLLVLLSLLTIVVSAWSNALSMLLKDIGSLASIVTGLQLPLTLLSGVLLPLEIGPTWMRVLAHANPLYYAVNAARDLAQGSILTTDTGIAFAVVGALAAMTLTWATRVYRSAVA